MRVCGSPVWACVGDHSSASALLRLRLVFASATVRVGGLLRRLFFFFLARARWPGVPVSVGIWAGRGGRDWACSMALHVSVPHTGVVHRVERRHGVGCLSQACWRPSLPVWDMAGAELRAVILY